MIETAAAYNSTLSCRACGLFARMVTEAPLDETSSCPICSSDDVTIGHLGELSDFRPLPYMRAFVTIQPENSSDVLAIKAGDIVVYSPEDGVLYFARVRDIWTGAAYAVGTLPGLSFNVSDTVTGPIRHWRGHKDGEPWWAFAKEIRVVQTAASAPAKGKAGRR